MRPYESTTTDRDIFKWVVLLHEFYLKEKKTMKIIKGSGGHTFKSKRIFVPFG